MNYIMISNIIDQMKFPNPVKSLGIIRHNQNIYCELSKNNLLYEISDPFKFEKKFYNFSRK